MLDHPVKLELTGTRGGRWLPLTLWVSVCFLISSFLNCEATAGQSQAGQTAEYQTVRELLATPADKIDLARAKLTLDKLVDPRTNITASLGQIDQMARTVEAMAGGSSTPSRIRLIMLRQYIYESGPWNDYKPFSYDMTDPLGLKPENRLLTTYLTRRRGNCVSMPILFIVLAERVGLRATLAAAPDHLFVKYFDNVTGKVFNLETTSGAYPARNIWYRENSSMSDKAIANGIYLRPLSKTEEVAVMAEEVLQFEMSQKRYQDVEDISDAILAAYPDSVNALLFQATASAQLIETEFRSRYPRADQIPPELRPRFLALQANNRLNFEKAEALGWRETDGQTPPKAAAGK